MAVPALEHRADALTVRRLTVSYSSRPVLWDVDARFPAGALSAVVGPNGAGKSTLLRAALGLLPIDAGQALVEGQPARAARERIAYVPQRDAVDWDFPITVREVVEMGRYRATGWIRRVGRSERGVVRARLMYAACATTRPPWPGQAQGAGAPRRRAAIGGVVTRSQSRSGGGLPAPTPASRDERLSALSHSLDPPARGRV